MFSPKVSIPHCLHCCWVLTLYDLTFRQLSAKKENDCSVLTKVYVWSLALSQLLETGGLFYFSGKSAYGLYFQVILKGSKERSTGATGVNADSSRSHAIIQIQIKDSAKRTFGR